MALICRRTVLAAATTLAAALAPRKPWAATKLHDLAEVLIPTVPPVAPADMPFFDASGSEHRLAAFRGHGMVVNLWATWCAPCVEELPSLLDLQRRNPDLAVVAVSTDQDDNVYRKFLIQHHVDVLTVRDSDQKVNALYGTVQIPETYIIDRQGLLRRKFIGAQNWTGPEITEYLHKL